MNVNNLHEYYDILNYLKSIEEKDFFLKKLINKKFLITGITGQLGSYLAKVLLILSDKFDLNISITGIGRNFNFFENCFSEYNNIKFVQWDLSDNSIPYFDNVNFDFLIHAASNANPNLYMSQPVETMTGNFIGLTNLLSLFINEPKKPKLIYISTGEVYGEIYRMEGILETDRGYLDNLNIRNSYPISKIATETLAISYSSEYNFDCSIVRLSHVYGPTTNENRVVDYMLMCGFERQDIHLKTTGSQIRSYVYILDATFAILFISLFGLNNEAYNVASDESKSIYEIGTEISEYCNININKTISESSDKRISIILNNEKVKSLGWKPMIDFKKGIRKTINIMRGEGLS